MTKDEMETITADDALVIDIREAEELEALPTLPEAVHIPLSEVLAKIENGSLPKDKKIVSVCRSGGRCSLLTETLRERGYDADYLEGGLIGLQKSGPGS